MDRPRVGSELCMFNMERRDPTVTHITEKTNYFFG
jgi:hypothetical protein